MDSSKANEIEFTIDKISAECFDNGIFKWANFKAFFETLQSAYLLVWDKSSLSTDWYLLTLTVNRTVPPTPAICAKQRSTSKHLTRPLLCRSVQKTAASIKLVSKTKAPHFHRVSLFPIQLLSINHLLFKNHFIVGLREDGVFTGEWGTWLRHLTQIVVGEHFLSKNLEKTHL